MITAEQHDVFERFVAGCRLLPNWMGVSTRREFFDEDLPFVTVAFPPHDAEYFEWIDVLEAVTGAVGEFTMLELGAGYGRWIVNAAGALRAYSGLPHRLTAVEAEPTHFRWLELHCRDNDVQANLLNAAVSAQRGKVSFAVGEPASWYGQAIADGTWSPERTVEVEAVTLSELLEPHTQVDLIHCDVQGVEATLFEEAIAAVDAKVKRVHVGTHGADVERRLRELFSSLGWESVSDFACGSVATTPWGRVTFQDGVQSWLNARVGE